MGSRRIYLISLLFAFGSIGSISIFLSLLFISPVSAGSNPIKATSQTNAVSFPNAITFQLSVHDASGAITRASLAISSQNPRVVKEIHPVAIHGTGPDAALQWREDITDTSFFPPGSVIQYIWQVQDNQHNQFPYSAAYNNTSVRLSTLPDIAGAAR